MASSTAIEKNAIDINEGDSVRTMNSKKNMQSQLEIDMAAFLSKGGRIQEVDMNISTDPPIKPTSKYGGGSI
ncbi:MAG: hypothetical protein JKY88_03505 [Pseudomonadales bacterium]|nr:hypothetical protein [Pseudomonadales bacterium]